MHPRPSRRNAVVAAVCAGIVSILGIGADVGWANPNIGYSRWCTQNTPGGTCYAWPGINQGWEPFGFGADFYYTHAADNYGQTLACWITPNGTFFWQWWSASYGRCAISSTSGRGATNVTGVWLETIPRQGDGIGAGSSWY